MSPKTGDFILYWMQASQRTEDNYALEFAISKANTLDMPFVVFFGITNDFPEANNFRYE